MCNIALEVSQAIVKRLWEKTVVIHFPKAQLEFKEKISLMDEEWQFPYAFGAVEWLSFTYKVLPGGSEAAKESFHFHCS